MIYFIQDARDNLIKIGTTIRLSQRLVSLATEYGVPLTTWSVLAVRDGGRNEEQALHLKFGHIRVEGEWFKPDGELLRFIKDECRLWDGIDEVSGGKLVRVSDEFAQAFRDAASFERCTASDFADLHLLPVVKGVYRDALIAKAKSVGYEPPPNRTGDE